MLLEEWEKAGAKCIALTALTYPAEMEIFTVEDERVGVRLNFNIPGGEHFMFAYSDWIDLLRRLFNTDRLSENFDEDVKEKLTKYFDLNSWVKFKKLLDENQVRYEIVDNWSLYAFSGKGHSDDTEKKNHGAKNGGQSNKNQNFEKNKRPRNFNGKNRRPRRDNDRRDFTKE